MKAGILCPSSGRKSNAIQNSSPTEDLAELPGDALRHEPFADAEPVEYLERALRPADAARALADAIGIVEQHDPHAALREIDRRGKPDRPGAHDDDRAAHRGPRVLVARTAVLVAVDRLVHVAHCLTPQGRQNVVRAWSRGHDAVARMAQARTPNGAPPPDPAHAQPRSAAHMARSRSAVQITGWSMPLASS